MERGLDEHQEAEVNVMEAPEELWRDVTDWGRSHSVVHAPPG